jgi:cytoskeletal protein RodZ
MKKQEEKSLDKLFEGLNELQQEQPSAAFLEDLELRLDALQQKRRKPLFAWWVWSVLGAVVIVSGLIGYSKKSSFSASNASNRNSSQYQTSIKSSALKQTSAPTSSKSSTSSFKLTSSTVTPLQDQSFISSSAISSSSSSS